MTPEFFTLSLLNGLSYGLLLFMLCAGLTLIFSLMGVLNFAHASFYMLGAYLGYALLPRLGFWAALLLAPLAVAALGAAFERWALRRTRRFGHVPELLLTFGFSYLVLELVQLVWGRSPLSFTPPPLLQGPAFTLVASAADGLSLVAGAAPAALCQVASCSPFPATRALMAGVAAGMLLLLWLLVTRTRIGLVVQAALSHPQMVEALGHNLPRVLTGVFALGCGLAGLAGVLGGATFVTEPAMAAALGPIIFVVVVVGGLGSLSGAFVAALLIGLLQTFALAVDASPASLLQALGLPLGAAIGAGAHDDGLAAALLRLKLSQLAPVLPYLLLVLMLIVRPRGLLGTRES